MAIIFHDDSIKSGLKNRRKIKSWIAQVIEKQGFVTGVVNIVFMSDEDLLQINTKYLNHHYYTDIISFDYSEKGKINGDICISVERVIENANNLGVAKENELLRVIVHGVLHLLGFNDHSDNEKKQMRIMENNYLTMFYSHD